MSKPPAVVLVDRKADAKTAQTLAIMTDIPDLYVGATAFRTLVINLAHRLPPSSMWAFASVDDDGVIFVSAALDASSQELEYPFR
ncbi:MAG: hypothetical protein KatS3mg082_3370 [Nitrospiraceae bacterium]|nr:MAG: hypothetical protein KatS3mg051_1835 [Anaerolineae bacterium]GIW56966.1 MAG: hypothetical protein KatS3mg082_3370 [Nitrospiraceae bacterium]